MHDPSRTQGTRLRPCAPVAHGVVPQHASALKEPSQSEARITDSFASFQAFANGGGCDDNDDEENDNDDEVEGVASALAAASDA